MTNEPAGVENGSANVVVVVLDTVRGLDAVPADDSPMPTVASLAAEGVEYRRAFATAPWTLPSHASLLTGTYTSRHDTHGDNPVLDESLVTLPEAFSAAGYDTLGVSNNTWVADEFGFDRGFETFRHAWRRDGRASSAERAVSQDDDEWRTRATADLRGEATTERAIEWLTTAREGPVFVFLNYIDAHFRYAPPEEYVADRLPPGFEYERAVNLLDDPRAYDAGRVTLSDEECAVLRTLYRGELAYLDDNLRRLVDGLEAAGEWADTLLVVTSDHGENVGEHGFVGHQYGLHDTLLHVPLVLAGGSFTDEAGRADEDRLVQLTDLAPTLLDEAGIDAPAARRQFQGRSFHPASSEPDRKRVVAEHVAPRPAVGTLERRYGELPAELYAVDRALPLRALRTDEHKLVLGSDGSRRLYLVDDGPLETADVADRHDDVTDRLEEELARWLESFDARLTRASTDVSAESRERLADLGYL